MQLPARLSKRRPDTHKGDYGHVFVLAGSEGLTGAAALSCQAALRSGAGLVTLGIPESLNPVMEAKLTETMTLPLDETWHSSLAPKALIRIKKFASKTDALLIGPGLSSDRLTQELIKKIIEAIDIPMVIDADGINALAKNLDILRRKSLKMKKRHMSLIITPHPGEMSRLIDENTTQIKKLAKKISQKFARDYHAVVVLKGSKTIVAGPDGKVYVNKIGNPGMATAGSGDVLSGIISSFLVQGLDGFKAAKYAVYLHSLAGDLAAKEKTQLGMIASDILDKIPEAIKKSS